MRYKHFAITCETELFKWLKQESFLGEGLGSDSGFDLFE